MSHFNWHLQHNTENQQLGQKTNAGTDDGQWSSVGLSNNDNDNIHLEQQGHERANYQWSLQDEIGTDPYSTMAFEGSQACSGGIESSWQNSTSYMHNTHHKQQQQHLERSSYIKKIPVSQVNILQPQRAEDSVGLHQPLLDCSKNSFAHSVVGDTVGTKNKDAGTYQHVKAQMDSCNVEDRKITKATCLTENNEALIIDKSMNDISKVEGTSVVATSTIAVSDILAAVKVESAFVKSTEILPTTASSVSSYSNADVSNIDTPARLKTDKPEVDITVSNAHVHLAAPNVNTVCDIPLSSVEDIDGTPSNEVIDRTQNTSNIVYPENYRQPIGINAPVIKPKLELENIDEKVIPKVENLAHVGSLLSASKNNGFVFKKVKEEEAVSLSSEQSTDSPVPENSILKKEFGRQKDSKNVRDRYRIIRQQYPEVVKRLDRLKMEAHSMDWRSTQKAPSEISENSSTLIPNRIQKSSSGLNINVGPNLRSVEPVLDFRNLKLNQSFTFPEHMSSANSSDKNDIYYGEDFVSSLRKSRHIRVREHNYYSTRGTKSEMGDIGPYRGPAIATHNHYMLHVYGNSTFPRHQSSEFYQSGRQSVGPSFGRHVAHELSKAHNAESSLPRRPQSSFDIPIHPKYQQKKRSIQSDEIDMLNHSSEIEEESSGSDSEIARIHYGQEIARRATKMRYSAMPITAPNEFYYFGVIQLPQDKVEYIMRRIPPPPEYYGLPPVEKAAYLFYCLLYQHHYHPVDLFHKKFNREYFSYMCEGDSAEIALWKICKHTQEEFLAKRSANHLKAYEMSQKQLFSDDRETLDSRQSERGSRCDLEDESDQLSLDSACKEPMKFRGSHSFLTFGIGGKAVLLDVKNSETVLEIRDMRSLIVDQKLLYVVSAIESFRGPLVPGFTQTHSVLLYIQRQIDIILKSEAYRLNPVNSGANDCLLMWQLLEMLVQQQGRVTGPDLSRLLMNGCHVIEHRRKLKENSHLMAQENFSENQVDPKAYDRFTQFLLGGHVKEALDSAMKDGLYSDAMILARRIAINEPHELDKVETAFLSHRSDLNPVMTLLAVANGQSASVLTNPPVDDANSWRPHAAIILANLNTPAAFGAVYQLGHALGRREMHIAADFCYLAVSLLAPSYNPFSPCFESDKSIDSRQHITLIHATLPGDGALNFESLNGFSVIDLHATEIFQFATKLADGWISQNLNRSIAYQMHRLEYTEMVSEFGNSVDAFRYCVEIARDIWNRCHEINIKHLERLYELAERLKMVASADANSTAWLPSMRSLIDERRKRIQAVEGVLSCISEEVDTVPDLTENKVVKVVAESSSNEKSNVCNQVPLDSKFVEWQIRQQEPTESVSTSVEEPATKQTSEINEYSVISGAPSEKLESSNNLDSSAHSQNSAVSCTFPMNTKNFQETSSTNCSTFTAVASTQANEGASCNTNRECNEERQLHVESLQMELEAGSKSLNTGVRTETVMGGVAMKGYENVHQNIGSLEKNLSLEIPSVITMKNRTEKTSHSSDEPSLASHPNVYQHQNYGTENSLSSQQQQANFKGEKTGRVRKSIKEHGHGSGIFSKLKATIAKAIPASNEMILPDDKNPSIVWDPKLNRYVGEGIEEKSVPEPPPSVKSNSEAVNGPSSGRIGGLTAARLSGGSRYFNPLIETLPSKPVAQTLPLLPPTLVTASFGFIPSTPDNDDVPGESPFSVDSGPAVQEAEVNN